MMFHQLLNRMIHKASTAESLPPPTSSKECVLSVLSSNRKFVCGELVSCCKAMGYPINYHDLLALLHELEQDGQIKTEWAGEGVLQHKIVSRI
jgi:hypothetical protein